MNIKETHKKITTWYKKQGREEHFFMLLLLIILASVFWIYSTSMPRSTILPKNVEIEGGLSLKEISSVLKREGIIRSKNIFTSLVIIKKGEVSVISGEYRFEKRIDTFEVVNRLVRADYGIPSKKIRIPEGATLIEIGELFEQEYRSFNKEAFYQLTKEKEGYLFPDTYTFLENVKTHEVVTTLTKNFDKKISELKSELGGFNIPLEDIVIMASIVEKESDGDHREEIADVLWHRIDIDMPLQVDASFVYSRGKGTFDLTLADLKDKDNPYNTYVYKGLPPTPISNPGLDSLRAAATPTTTTYLFFLTGKDGKTYYAETFEEHKKNKSRYLN